ncbi:MAG TPA: histidinol dehydrogenase [Steroidobacteraceae bacterium]|nr:histidinol dehydrogenase [Steroidobacteraceae bacterium]
MRILDWDTLDSEQRRAALARPQLQSLAEAIGVAREVIASVRHSGDEALHRLTRRFDAVELDALSVPPGEFARARRVLERGQIAALERALANVHAFHAAQMPQPLALEIEPGVRCEQLLRPLSAVGLYVPAGSAPLPSAVIMLAVPARIAACPTRVLCTPPQRDGSAHPAVLVAAELCGIDTVFKVGGAQAIAALAYGTQSIPRVDKIFGPGNAWVTAAKQLVANDPLGAACDLPAGPSEVLVIADATARADFVAADLLAQAEHDPLAQALLVTDSRELAVHVAQALNSALPRLTRRSILEQSLAACRCILVPDLTTALAVANEYAPEHLLLQVREPRHWLTRVRNAGAVFLGSWSPEPLGDYCTGANHVLPTGGYARALSGLSVRDFLKTITVQELSPAGLSALGPTAVTLALLEGLDAHAQAVTRRLGALAAALS